MTTLWALPDWVAAKAALPALKAAAAVVLKSRADRSAYNAAIASVAAQRTRVTTALAAPGLPAGVTAAYGAAFGPMSTKETARDWVGALAEVTAYKKALADADKALEDGKKFYTAYAPVRAEDIQARALLVSTDNRHQNNAKLSAAGTQFAHYREILEKAIAEPDWGDAKDVLADLQVAAREFIAEAARHKAARAPYDTALGALRNRDKAERAVEPPTPPLAVTAAAYKKQRKARLRRRRRRRLRPRDRRLAAVADDDRRTDRRQGRAGHDPLHLHRRLGHRRLRRGAAGGHGRRPGACRRGQGLPRR